jgi:hypothetical protein
MSRSSLITAWDGIDRKFAFSATDGIDRNLSSLQTWLSDCIYASVQSANVNPIMSIRVSIAGKTWETAAPSSPRFHSWLFLQLEGCFLPEGKKTPRLPSILAYMTSAGKMVVCIILPQKKGRRK